MGLFDVVKEKWNIRKERRALEREIRHEAQKEAILESKYAIKEQMKKKMIDKASGKDRERRMEKLKEAFSVKGVLGNSTEKLNRMMGTGNSNFGAGMEKMMGRGNVGGSPKSKLLDRHDSEDKLQKIMGHPAKKGKEVSDDHKEFTSNALKKMMGK